MYYKTVTATPLCTDTTMVKTESDLMYYRQLHDTDTHLYPLVGVRIKQILLYLCMLVVQNAETIS